MLIPYSVDVPLERWPIANWCVLALTVSVGVAEFSAPAPTGLGLLLGDLPWWYGGMLHREGFSVTQLFTHPFLHADIIHLGGNMVFLFCFGNAVNAKLGHALYLAAYFVLGAVAGVAWLLIGEGPAALGASGAIMGIIGLYLVYFPRNDVRVLYFFWLFYIIRAGTFELSSYWMILLYVALDVFGFLSGGGNVAYIAHLSGTACGLGAGILLLSTGLVRSSEAEENLLQFLRVRR